MAGAFVLALLWPSEQANAQIAIVVHRSSPMTVATTEELRRIFLGTTKTFSDGTQVTVLETPGLRDQFYKALLGMSEAQVKRRWIQLVFAGETATPPVQFTDEVEARRYVASHPGSIAFITLGMVDATVKSVQVVGNPPASSSHKLR